jgi:hypothetical protein
MFFLSRKKFSEIQKNKTLGRSDGIKMIINNTMHTEFGNMPLHSTASLKHVILWWPTEGKKIC